MAREIPPGELIAYSDPLLAVVAYDDPNSATGQSLEVAGRVSPERVPEVLRDIADRYEESLAARNAGHD